MWYFEEVGQKEFVADLAESDEEGSIEDGAELTHWTPEDTDEEGRFTIFY